MKKKTKTSRQREIKNKRQRQIYVYHKKIVHLQKKNLETEPAVRNVVPKTVGNFFYLENRKLFLLRKQKQKNLETEPAVRNVVPKSVGLRGIRGQALAEAWKETHAHLV